MTRQTMNDEESVAKGYMVFFPIFQGPFSYVPSERKRGPDIAKEPRKDGQRRRIGRNEAENERSEAKGMICRERDDEEERYRKEEETSSDQRNRDKTGDEIDEERESEAKGPHDEEKCTREGKRMTNEPISRTRANEEEGRRRMGIQKDECKRETK